MFYNPQIMASVQFHLSLVEDAADSYFRDENSQVNTG